ncbi:PaaX domain-containing protein, C- domain protein [Aeromicrobium sp. A1-2]|uniref:PaaX family transcriptional regulator C-terminal domain-containing protein n=1 Tax=Aeromicrobium sp. A1-2 TaxID=2107713 RepID=UPI000E4F6300|nr:PaaX family transcriptional regulator C-terminal domain-containing protein [Aeromicrobium sp. A1-2]AXT84246.1 PaaX domain-containing protein, C- domain protein [Aeromicrobium sp. A1-2]
MPNNISSTGYRAGNKPLSARSMLLSLVLGAHPEGLSPAKLVAAGEYFEVSSSTTRAALARAVQSGDLRRAGRDYVLGDALLRRQRRQNEAMAVAEVPWNGDWEVAVIVETGRSASARAALRDELRAYRLAELREGVWMRPANLSRLANYRSNPVISTFRAKPDEDAGELADKLWNLGTWGEGGRNIVDALRKADSRPAHRLAIAAHLVRHLTEDPILPTALLPPGWPGDSLRTAYAQYQHELRLVSDIMGSPAESS